MPLLDQGVQERVTWSWILDHRFVVHVHLLIGCTQLRRKVVGCSLPSSRASYLKTGFWSVLIISQKVCPLYLYLLLLLYWVIGFFLNESQTCSLVTSLFWSRPLMVVFCHWSMLPSVPWMTNLLLLLLFQRRFWYSFIVFECINL